MSACAVDVDERAQVASAAPRAQEAGACCGCLCADARWSCSADTCTDVEGAVLSLAPEAGFLEVEAGFVDRRAKGRMFYAFQPAEGAPEDKPLMVMLGGGPFTSVLPLWAANTAPRTLDPAVTGAALIADTAYPWTRFANLLFIDSPFAGFSYVVEGSAAPGWGEVDLIGEAAAFTSMLMRFLAHHPQLERNRIILVGESYGGLRANHMLTQLLRYRALRSDGTPYGAALSAEIERHLVRAIGPVPFGGFTPQQIGRHLGQVQIQGIPAPITPIGRARTAISDARANDQVDRLLQMTEALLQPEALRGLTGVAVETIAWMGSEARMAEGLEVFESLGFDTDVRTYEQTLASEAAFSEVFGPIPLGFPQVYLRPYVRVLLDFNVGDPFARFADALRWVPTFITNAADDATVSSDALIARLPSLPGVRSATRRRVDTRLDQVAVSFTDGASRTVHLPRYANSGHAVSMFEAELLADDLARWLAQPIP
ncbi:MAG: hypothetical protein ABW252_23795 [Polyangiales bacterium]